MYDGIINIYKEKGYTSHDVVAKLRGILRMKKIGHTGTLDPDAQGVLPVCVGKGTKLVDMITDKDKTYVAVGKLGVTTDTQDISGKVLFTADCKVTCPQLQEAISAFQGEYLQLPPMFSAIKVDGKKLYELARQGIEIERERRPVLIKKISLIAFDEEAQEFTVEVDCGKGTYIRTLLHDIGLKLGCGCTMKQLERTAVGQFKVDQSLRLSELEALVREEGLAPFILTIDQVFEGLMKLATKEEFDKLVHNGNAFLPEQAQVITYGNEKQQEKQLNKLQNKEFSQDQVRVYDSQERFIGIYGYHKERACYMPIKMFL